MNTPEHVGHHSSFETLSREAKNPRIVNSSLELFVASIPSFSAEIFGATNPANLRRVKSPLPFSLSPRPLSPSIDSQAMLGLVCSMLAFSTKSQVPQQVLQLRGGMELGPLTPGNFNGVLQVAAAITAGAHPLTLHA
jgi:hypothetical protein